MLNNNEETIEEIIIIEEETITTPKRSERVNEEPDTPKEETEWAKMEENKFEDVEDDIDPLLASDDDDDDDIISLLKNSDDSANLFPVGEFVVTIDSIEFKLSKTNKEMIAIKYKNTEAGSSQVWFENFILSGVESNIKSWNLSRLKKVLEAFNIPMDDFKTMDELVITVAKNNDNAAKISVSYKILAGGKTADFPTIIIG